MYCDNVGAIFVATARMMHFDVRYHFAREFVESLKIVFVNSKDNKVDMLMKNDLIELYDKHKEAYIVRRQGIESIRNIEGRV
jgi:hypothetical protein